jgi:hypothetical protein
MSRATPAQTGFVVLARKPVRWAARPVPGLPGVADVNVAVEAGVMVVPLVSLKVAIRPLRDSSRLTVLLLSSKLSISALAVEQVELQTPFVHVAPLAQGRPQPPQLAGSVSVLVQALLQTALPVGAVRGPQVPVARPVFALLHPWHERLHCPAQQIPSLEQNPLVHWVAAVQVAPVAFLATHAPDAQ